MKRPALLAGCLLFPLASLAAQTETPPRNESETRIFELLNHERASRGLAELLWDDALFKAARQHALLMLNLNTLEHQLPGEPGLAERLAAAGARFSFISENIAVGSEPGPIHEGWMGSPGHRKNILDARATHVGIAAVRGRGGLYVVEDFSQAFVELSAEQQEKQVAALLVARGFRVVSSRDEARKACDGNLAMTGIRSKALLRFETPDLHDLPPEADKKVRRESYGSAAVGACHTSAEPGFARYRIAVLFF